MSPASLESLDSETPTNAKRKDEPNIPPEKKLIKALTAVDLKKCGDFLTQQSGNDLNAMFMQIKKRLASVEILELTEYQLRASDQQEIIVQQNPREESKNQVRVFKAGDDGFPDRLKNFPNSDGNPEQRLEGALTLGKLIRKIDKFSLVSNDGAQVRLEKQNNEITRIDFTSGHNQLICEDKLCACTTY